jgi:hypothetical protein
MERYMTTTFTCDLDAAGEPLAHAIAAVRIQLA